MRRIATSYEKTYEITEACRAMAREHDHAHDIIAKMYEGRHGVLRDAKRTKVGEEYAIAVWLTTGADGNGEVTQSRLEQGMTAFCNFKDSKEYDQRKKEFIRKFCK